MRITLRRLFALPVVVVFLLLFVITLVAFRVNGTLLEASFYTDTLRKLDAYNFTYDAALPAALEDHEVDTEDVGLGISLTHVEIVAYVKRVLPPEWVQENVEQVVEQVVPYATGQTDEFSITIPLADRVEDAVEVAEELVRDADIYNYLLEELARPEMEKNDVLSDLPYGMTLTPDQVIAGIEEVLPEEWLRQRIEEVLDEITPYATGKEDDFAILIPLQDRADAALPVLEGWLLTGLDGGTYDYLLEEQIAPTASDSLGPQVGLPFGITITDDEVVDAIGQVLPLSWVSDRISDAFGAMGPYLTGQTDSFTIEIPLRDRVEIAAETLQVTTDAKLRAFIDSLPTCTLQQLQGLELSLEATPECVPPGVTYELLQGLVGLDIEEQLESLVVQQLPEVIEFTDEDLLALLGPDVPLEQTREQLRNGITFTDQDLRRLILEQGGQENVDLLDDVRRYLKEGLNFTEQDIRDEIGASDFDTLDDVRGYVDTVRSLLFLLIIVLLIVAAIIGFLGGRSWWSRLGWAGVPLVISGAAVAAALSVGKGRVKDRVEEEIRDADILEVLIDKSVEVQPELINVFFDPLAVQGGVVLVAGAVMVGLGFYGSFFRRRQAAEAMAGPEAAAGSEAIADSETIADPEATDDSQATDDSATDTRG